MRTKHLDQSALGRRKKATRAARYRDAVSVRRQLSRAPIAAVCALCAPPQVTTSVTPFSLQPPASPSSFLNLLPGMRERRSVSRAVAWTFEARGRGRPFTHLQGTDAEGRRGASETQPPRPRRACRCGSACPAATTSSAVAARARCRGVGRPGEPRPTSPLLRRPPQCTLS